MLTNEVQRIVALYFVFNLFSFYTHSWCLYSLGTWWYCATQSHTWVVHVKFIRNSAHQ